MIQSCPPDDAEVTREAVMRHDASTAPVSVGEYQMKTVENAPLLLCKWKEPERLEALASLLLELEPQILKLPKGDDDEQSSGNETTVRYASYNILEVRDPLAKQLYDAIKCGYVAFLELLGRPRESMYIQCWVNIVRAGESMRQHWHSFPMNGHMTVQADCGQTVYGTDPEIGIPNEPGLFTFVGKPGLLHRVPTYLGERPRISIAFDLLPLAWVLNYENWRNAWESSSFMPFD